MAYADSINEILYHNHKIFFLQYYNILQKSALRHSFCSNFFIFISANH